MPDLMVRHNGIQEHNHWCNCLHCRLEWDDRQEAEHALRLLNGQNTGIRQAKPATDTEWAEFMDGQFPREVTP